MNHDEVSDRRSDVQQIIADVETVLAGLAAARRIVGHPMVAGGFAAVRGVLGSGLRPRAGDAATRLLTSLSGRFTKKKKKV